MYLNMCVYICVCIHTHTFVFKLREPEDRDSKQYAHSVKENNFNVKELPRDFQIIHLALCLYCPFCLKN